MADERIALDVMGGDRGPRALLEGALQACDPAGPVGLERSRVVLVGDSERIAAELGERARGFQVVHASQSIDMHEKPAQALRAKPDSSIAVGVGTVRAGGAGAFVSMGNTGAVVGASTLGLGTLPGVRRPGIAVTLDLTGHPVTILDVGANIVPKAAHLLQYGIMGTAYMRDCFGIDAPRVGLLNIGEEPGKGTQLLHDAHALLAGSSLEFVGNVESGNLFAAAADVIITDGFTGNVTLKLMEGMAGFMLDLVLRELRAHQVQWGPEALARVKKEIDYSEYGGALLLGVSGIVVIGHGRSDATAVANALGLAARTLDAEVNADIVRALEAPSCEAHE